MSLPPSSDPDRSPAILAHEASADALASARLTLDLLVGAVAVTAESGRYREAAMASRDMAQGINLLARRLSDDLARAESAQRPAA